MACIRNSSIEALYQVEAAGKDQDFWRVPGEDLVNEAIATKPLQEETVSDTEDSNDFYSSGSSDDDEEDDDDSDEVQILCARSKFRELVTIPNPLDYDVLTSARKRNGVKFEMMYLNMDSYEVIISGMNERDVQNAKFQLLHNQIL